MRSRHARATTLATALATRPQVLIPKRVGAAMAAWALTRADLPNIVELAQSVPQLSTLVTAVSAPRS